MTEFQANSLALQFSAALFSHINRCTDVIKSSGKKLEPAAIYLESLAVFIDHLITQQMQGFHFRPNQTGEQEKLESSFQKENWIESLWN